MSHFAAIMKCRACPTNTFPATELRLLVDPSTPKCEHSPTPPHWPRAAHPPSMPNRSTVPHLGASVSRKGPFLGHPPARQWPQREPSDHHWACGYPHRMPASFTWMGLLSLAVSITSLSVTIAIFLLGRRLSFRQQRERVGELENDAWTVLKRGVEALLEHPQPDPALAQLGAESDQVQHRPAEAVESRDHQRGRRRGAA